MQRQGGKGNDGAPGHPDGHRAPGDRPNGQGAGAIIVREIAMAPALTESWRGSATGKGRRGRAGTEIGTEATEGTGRGGDPAAQTGTKTGENVEEVAAAAGNEETNAETKKETAGMTGAGGRTGITIKIEALRGRGPRIRRAGERLTTGGIKTTGRGTEKKGRPKGQAGVEAGRGSTRVERRRTGKESAATAGRETGSETENSDLTSVVVAKRGVIINVSPVMTTVNIVIAEGVRALSKCRLAAILLLLLPVFFFIFSTQLSDPSLVLKK